MSFDQMKYGPIGAAVEAAEPHSEADPVGIYAAALAMWSSAISGSVVMDSGRPVVVWTVLAGRSALGRKGWALRTATTALAPSIGGYVSTRVRSGVTSGPSLVNLLYELEQDSMSSETGPDGRALIVEEEWSSILKRARSCKTFSQQLRTAWDGASISNRTKTTFEVVERPLLGLHAHITPGEWQKYISSTDALGGTYNRVLPVLVERSKMLPWNHVPDIRETKALTDAYKWCTDKPRVMSFTAEAGKRYDELRAAIEDKMAAMPESLSCYLERSAEQIARVSAVLTAAQKKTKIPKAAVDAAWAFVQYSMVSVEKLVTTAAQQQGKPAKELPVLIREVLNRYEGEATSTLMLRALGTRATAASLKAAVERMEDVEMFKDTAHQGRGAKPIVYRLIQGGVKACPKESPGRSPVKTGTTSTATKETPKNTESGAAESNTDGGRRGATAETESVSVEPQQTRSTLRAVPGQETPKKTAKPRKRAAAKKTAAKPKPSNPFADLI